MKLRSDFSAKQGMDKLRSEADIVSWLSQDKN